MDIGTVDHLLTTTRSVRKRLDLSRSVEPETIQRCLDIAIQAPAGGNLAPYHFLVVTDPTRRFEIAELYKRALIESYIPRRSRYLGEHLAEVPAHMGRSGKPPCMDASCPRRGRSCWPFERVVWGPRLRRST